MAKQFYFCFIRPEDISPESTNLSPCAVANHSLAFLMAVLKQWLLPCWAGFQVMSNRTNFTVDNIERVSFLSGMTAAWSHGVYICVLLFIQINVVPSAVWKLLPMMKQTCGGLQLFFWDLGKFLLIFPWCKA
jgi:hypothetical protein